MKQKKKPLRKARRQAKASRRPRGREADIKRLRPMIVPSLLVSACMTDKVDIANPDQTIAEAARKMRDEDFGSLPVCDGDQIIGMITDRDIVVRSVAEGKDPEQTKVSEVMTQKVLYCYNDQTINEVAKNMGSNQVKRLLVMNREKRLVGILSLGDIAQSRECASHATEALSHITEPAHREPRARSTA